MRHISTTAGPAERAIEQEHAVIFDMDGVLIDSADAHLTSWRRLAAECGGAITDEQFAATFGRQNDDIIPLLFGDVSTSRLAALADRKEAIYRDLVRDRPPIVDGAVELIQGLHRRGVRLAIGSSAPSENIRLIVGAMGVADLFDAVVCDADVTRGKPDPQVFALAATRLGIEPERCIVVEDAPAGVQAARAAGMHVIAVLLHHRATAFNGVDLCVSRLADLSVERLLAIA